jgi:RHS repeat-associated protein
MGGMTQMEYDDENRVTKTTDANNLVTKYTYDDAGNLTSRSETYCGCAGVVPEATTYTYNTLGQQTSITMPTGVVTDSYVYDAYGSLLSSSGSTTNSYLFTGEQFDNNLGEYYLRARYYDPGVGRFTARDPFDGWLSDPLSLNKYGYVHGNPVNSIDPTGLFTMTESSAGFSISSIFSAMNVALPYVRAAAPFARAAAIGVGVAAVGVSAYSQKDIIKLAMSYIAVKACNLFGSSNCRTFIPIVFYGNNFGVDNQGRLNRLEETTQHVYESIVFESRAPIVSQRIPAHDRTWLAGTTECNSTARSIAMSILNRNETPRDRFSVTCDEYPFASTEQGGAANYSRGGVSLKFVPGWETTPQANLMSRAKLRAAGVDANDPFEKWYGVIAIPGMRTSFWRSRTGQIQGPTINP